MTKDLVLTEAIDMSCPYCGRDSFNSSQALREHKNRCSKSRSRFKKGKEVRSL